MDLLLVGFYFAPNYKMYRIRFPDKDSFLLLERRNTLPYKHSLLAIFKAEMNFHSLKIISALSRRPKL